jgi:hypothetical protein
MRIEIVVGNIVRQPDVDALVNSANANLRFGPPTARLASKCLEDTGRFSKAKWGLPNVFPYTAQAETCLRAMWTNATRTQKEVSGLQSSCLHKPMLEQESWVLQ